MFRAPLETIVGLNAFGEKKMRTWLANRLLGLATLVLPEGHQSIPVIYDAAWTIDDHEWPKKRDAEWFSLVMNAAAAIEDAENCLGDPDAKRTSNGAAKHYRNAANVLFERMVPNV